MDTKDLTLIATVLPFGKGTKAGRPVTRFSITLDVSPNAQPAPAELLRLYQRYAAFAELVQTKTLRLRSTSPSLVGEATVIDYRVSRERQALWDALFPAGTKMKAADQAPLTNPHAGFLACTALVGSEPDLRPLGQAAYSLAAAKDGERQELRRMAPAALANSRQVWTTARSAVQKLKAMSEFALADQGQNAYRQMSRTTADAGEYSLDTIFDTVGALSGNTIMQRLSGLTLDVELVTEFLNGQNDFALQVMPEPLQEALTQVLPGLSVQLEMPFTRFHRISSPQDNDCLLDVITVADAPARAKKAAAESRREAGLAVHSYDRLSQVLSYSQLLEEKLESQPQLRAKINPVNPGEVSELTVDEHQILGELFQPPRTLGARVTQRPDIEGLTAVLQSGSGKRAADQEEVFSRQELVKGNRFAVQQGNNVMPLGRRRCVVRVTLPGQPGYELALPEELTTSDFAIGSETAIKAMLPADPAVADGPKVPGYVIDHALLTWSGENIAFPSMFHVAEDETNAQPTALDGGVEGSTELAMRRLRSLFVESFFPYFPAVDKRPMFSLEYHFTVNPQLLFGKQYTFVLTKEYKNNWGIPFRFTDTSTELQRYYNCTAAFTKCAEFTFRRNEPIGPVMLYLKEALTDEHSRPVAQREGESVKHLVIRKFARKRTRQRSVRHLMPPQISFEHAFWHGKIAEIDKQFGRKHSYEWYLRYTCRAEDARSCKRIPRCTRVCSKIAMREYYPHECEPAYLPDPLASGFRLEFHLDSERQIPAPDFAQATRDQFLYEGSYPYLKGFQFEVRAYRANRPRFERRNRKIILRLHPGETVYLTARTILANQYHQELETYGVESEALGLGVVDKLTPPLLFSAVHALQQPLIAPEIRQVVVHREFNSPQVVLDATVKTEQLNLYHNTSGRPLHIPSGLPTGELELLAKWEEVVDDAAEIIPVAASPGAQRTPRDPLVPLEAAANQDTQETNIDIKSQLRQVESALRRESEHVYDARNYVTALRVAYEARDKKHVLKYLSLREKSPFTSYYPQTTQGQPTNFQRTSDTRLQVHFLNCEKPVSPSLNGFMLLRVNEQQRHRDGLIVRRTAGRRIKITLNRPLLTSGAGARVGVLLYEPLSPYNEHFKHTGQLSRTGSDLLTGSRMPVDSTYGTADVFLNHTHFVLADPVGMRALDRQGLSQDLTAFQPRYVPELGCLSFVPQFDPGNNQWFIEVELNLVDEQGQEVYTPFLQFSLVQYQEQSCVFPAAELTAAAKLAKDCRLSEPIVTGFAYLQPTRQISVLVTKEGVEVGVACDPNAVSHFGEQSRNAFYAAVQSQPKAGVVWEWHRKHGVAPFARLDSDRETRTVLAFAKERGLRYRLVVLEAEHWGTDRPASFAALLESRSTRVVLVSTFPA